MTTPQGRWPLVTTVGCAAVMLAACGSSATSGQSSATSPPVVASSPTVAAPSSGAASTSVIPASSECAAAASKPGAQTSATADYYMVLSVGEPEQMYTEAQVQSMRPTAGEVMVAGTMMGASTTAQASSSGMDAMPGMGGSASPAAGTRHVEVMICDRTTGKVIVGAKPTMTMGSSTSSMASISVAQMYGVDAGPVETHYGNNVPMTAGQVYTISGTLNDQTATFTVTAPA